MKHLSDRRQDTAELIEYYKNQARLAELGLSTRRSAEFCRRQILFLLSEGSR